MSIDDALTALRARANIIEIAEHLGHRINKRRWNTAKIVCPFHPDWDGDGGSLQLNLMGHRNGQDSPNWFHCHGCGTSGSVFSFMCLCRNRDPKSTEDFYRSVIEVAQILGLENLVPHSKLAGRSSALAGLQRLGWLAGDLFYLPDVPTPCETWQVSAEVMTRMKGWYLHRLQPKPTADTPTQVVWARDHDAAVFLRQPDLLPLAVAVPLAARTRVRQFGGRPHDAALICGQELSGGEAADQVLGCVMPRLAVENPLDAMRLRAMGVPVVWGLWITEGGLIKGPVASAVPGTIPALVALQLGETSISRMRRCLSLQQGWIPREAWWPEVTEIWSRPSEIVEQIAVRSLTETQALPTEASQWKTPPRTLQLKPVESSPVEEPSDSSAS